MSCKLKLNKTKMHLIIRENSRHIPKMKDCQFSHSEGVYWMTYIHPDCCNLIQVTVQMVDDIPSVCFSNLDDVADAYISEKLSFRWLLEHDMIEGTLADDLAPVSEPVLADASTSVAVPEPALSTDSRLTSMHRLKLNKAKMYCLVSEYENNLPRMKECDFFRSGRIYFMTYVRPFLGFDCDDLITVWVQAVSGVASIRFSHLKDGVEHFYFSKILYFEWLLAQGMLEEVT